ncbi:HAD family hydrolase [Streptomyces acidiscabies]|uniref:HAD family hydrolase n=1 Tax=Streptomyces acidiscabies TaxID=42234 RepID=UPI0030D581F3
MRLALFDLDGTLVDRAAALSATVAGLCRDHGYDPAVGEWLLTELAENGGRDVLGRLPEAFGIVESPEHLWRVYVDRMAASVVCRPDVLESLGRLREHGWSIGVVTNGSSDLQRAKIRSAGLADLVDGIAASGDIDVRKPDPRLFELAAARCGTQLTAGDWMTGDDPVKDIAGAAGAGLRAIWVRGRTWPEGLDVPHHSVADVVEAVGHLLERSGG